VVYGRPPPTLLSYEPGVAQVVALDRQLLERDAFLADIRERLLQAQDYMKEHHDKTHRRVEFEVGDWVWLRLHHRAAALVKGGSSKLSPRYYGLFQVLARIGSVAYRLQLPPKSRLHDVFHVVFLKKYTGDSPTTTLPLPPIFHGWAVPALAAVLRARPSSTLWDLLIQWQGSPMLTSHGSRCNNSRSRSLISSLRTSCFLTGREVLWTDSSVTSSNIVTRKRRPLLVARIFMFYLL